MRAFLPNLMTLANAFCGGLAIVFLFHDDIERVWLFFVLALLFDVLDGAIARLLGLNSALGKELDSLADTISFTLLPGLVLYQWLFAPPFNTLLPQTLSTHVIAAAGLVFTASGIFRLAIFNIDEGQSRWFTGLPTPAAAIFIIAMSVLLETQSAPEWLFHRYSLYGLIFLFSWLMISDFKIINLKISSLNWSDNWYRYVLIVPPLVGALLSWQWALMSVIPWLIVWSLIYYGLFHPDD